MVQQENSHDKTAYGIHDSNSRRALRAGLMLLPVLLSCVVMASSSAGKEAARAQVVTIVAEIQRADYEGDRAALKRLHEQLAPFAKNQELASRVLYWQGFALWRRAINGFNEQADTAELQGDLQTALDEFDEATRLDPAFVDAKVGALSCLASSHIPGGTKIPPAQRQLSNVRVHGRYGRSLRPKRLTIPASFGLRALSSGISLRNTEEDNLRLLRPTRRDSR